MKRAVWLPAFSLLVWLSAAEANAMPMWMLGPDAWRQLFLLRLVVLTSIVVLALVAACVTTEVRRRLGQRG